MQPKQTLADHPDYRITLHRASDQPSEHLIVSFGGQPSDIADEGFGTHFALDQGWDTIFVAQRHGTQYQGLPLEAFAAAVAPVTEGRDTIAYGSSLGGYCALYYGGTIGARILAASPMLPAWRPLKIKRYADLPMTHRDLADCPKSGHSPVIIYDPERAQDHFLVEQMVMPVYPDARLVKVPYGGHTILATLAELRSLKPLITGIIAHDTIMTLTPPGPSHAIWHIEHAKKYMSKDRPAAIGHLKESLSIKPTKQAFSMLVNALLIEKRTDEAQHVLNEGKASGNKSLTPVPSVQRQIEAAGLTV